MNTYTNKVVRRKFYFHLLVNWIASHNCLVPLLDAYIERNQINYVELYSKWWTSVWLEDFFYMNWLPSSSSESFNELLYSIDRSHSSGTRYAWNYILRAFLNHDIMRIGKRIPIKKLLPAEPDQ